MSAKVLETVHCLQDGVGDLICPQTLRDRIAGADTITIISAYYDVNFLLNVFEGKKPLSGKDITFVFNGTSASLDQRNRLLDFRSLLLAKGTKSSRVSVRVANASRFLHSKVYQFKRGKWKRTLVGSANATANGFGRNDEILIEVAGRHLGIESYVNHLVRTSEDCREISSNNYYHDFESMLRDGYIYFEPKRALSFSIDCFSDRPELQFALEKTIGGEPLRFHDGASVGSLNILKMVGITESKEEKPSDSPHKKTPYVIETALGYWVPSAFRPDVERLIVAKSSVKERQLLAKGIALSQAAPALAEGLTAYLDDVSNRLAKASVKLNADDRDRLRKKVQRRFDRIRDALQTSGGCRRYARTLEGTPMPELWEDPYSAEVVKETFCDYVSEQLKTTTKRHVVKRLAQRFALRAGDDTDDVRQKIQQAFDRGPIAPTFWAA